MNHKWYVSHKGTVTCTFYQAMDDVNSEDDFTTVVQREAESTTPHDGNLGCSSENPSELLNRYCMYYVQRYFTWTVQYNIAHTEKRSERN